MKITQFPAGQSARSLLQFGVMILEARLAPADYYSEPNFTSLTRFLRAGGILLANVLLLLALTAFAVLREDPMFWRNAGGWPIWLRDLVQLAFYPLLAVELGLLLGMSWLAWCCPILKRLRRPVWPLTGAMWLWGSAVVLVVVGNNVANLLTGRPLHWHMGG